MCYVAKVLTTKEAQAEAKRLRKMGIEVVASRPVQPGRVEVTYRVPPSLSFGHSGESSK